MVLPYKRAWLMHCIGLMLVCPVFGQDVLFDFDNAPIHTSLPISQAAGGITAHLYATGQGYSIQEANALGFTPPGFGGLVIYPNSINLADLLIKFDTTLVDFSIMYSCQELGCDDAATMRVTAYLAGNLTGTKTTTASNPGTWPVETLRCTFPQGFDSVVVHYDKKPPTCQDYGVIFLADNMHVTVKSVLAIKLTYFNCEANGDAAIIKWKATGDNNLSGYVVQYASDGKDFRDLGSVTAASPNNDYVFIHHYVAGTAYYRLKIVDNDRTYTFSEIKKLVFSEKPGLTIFPNPAFNYIQVNDDNTTGKRTIQLLSANGVVLRTIKNYSGGQKITVSELPKGTYILKIFSSKQELLFEKMFVKM